MESKLYDELKLRYPPVAIIFSDGKSEEAIEFEEDRWACVVTAFMAAAKGKTAVISRERSGCNGGKIGLCLGKASESFRPGFEYFLSTGGGDYEEGEGYVKTPELARKFMEALPDIEIAEKYVIFKALPVITDNEKPTIIVFLANPDQISALTVLANYAREATDSVIMPMGAGCHQICLLPYHYSLNDPGKAVVGMTDVTARKFYDPDLLTFAVPYSMFEEMETNIAGSFLNKPDWKEVRTRIE